MQNELILEEDCALPEGHAGPSLVETIAESAVGLVALWAGVVATIYIVI